MAEAIHATMLVLLIDLAFTVLKMRLVLSYLKE